MSSPASTANLIGSTLEGRYRIVREIGRGGMGVVFEGEHIELGKRVAIKLMRDEYATDSDATARFRREALAASRIGNSHIIDVSHIGTADDGRPFVVMELLVGTSLAREIERGPIPYPRAIHIIRQVLRAVGAAHAKGIVHRDLKPDNIFLIAHDDERDFVKLLDFGISKMLDSADVAGAHTKLTTTGMIMGTPLYMAPEQAMGEAIDHRVDVYACGVILYEMLVGKPPFEGATYPVLIAKMLTTDAQPVAERVRGLPPALTTAVDRSLAKDPNARWQSSEQFVQALPRSGTASMSGDRLAAIGTEETSVQPATATPIPTPQARPSAPSLGPSATTAPTPAKSRAGLWIGLGAVAAVGLGAAVFAVVSARGSDGDGRLAGSASGSAATAGSSAIIATPVPPAPPVAAPPDAAVEQTGTLSVQTTPAGATVKVDRTLRGPTPIEVVLPPGPHEVQIELKGYVTLVDKVDVQLGAQTPIARTLTALIAPGSTRPRPPPPPPPKSLASPVTHLGLVIPPPPLTPPTSTATPTPTPLTVKPAGERPTNDGSAKDNPY